MQEFGSVLGLLGVLVGGIITYFTMLKIERVRSAREGAVIAAAIAAEISSILSIIRRHNYAIVFTKGGQAALRGERTILKWNASLNYCRVFEGVVGKIGSLPTGASEVVHFYNTMQSTIEDQIQMSKFVSEAEQISKTHEFDWRTLAPIYLTMSDKIDLVVQLGNQALVELDRKAVKKR